MFKSKASGEILENYKLTELHSVFADDNWYLKYVFFEDSCKMIMDVFEHASEVPKKDVNE